MAEIVVKLVNGELAGKTAQSIAKEVTAAALAFKKAEIGTKEWVEANKKLEEVKALQEDLKDQTEGLASASDLLKKAWDKLPGAKYFNEISESFGLMKKSVGGLVTQFGVLRTAIAATGIGLLVLLLSSLVSWFTTTQEGMDKLSSVTRPLKAVFDALKGVLQDLGGKVFKTLSEAIENPKQALKDLGQILLDQVINRFKAFALLGPAIKKIFSGDISGGLKDLGNATLQVVTGVTNVIDKLADAGKTVASVIDAAWQKGKRIDELQKMIEKSEIEQITRSKQLDLLLKQQKDIIEDGSKSWDQRREAAKKALEIQQQMLALELNLTDKRIEKLKLEQSLNAVSREDLKELAELEAHKLEIQAAVTEQSIEFKKKVQEFDKAQADEQLSITQNIEDLKLEVMREGMTKEIAEIELQTQRRIEALNGSAEQITEQEALLEESKQQQIQAVKDKYAQEAYEKNKEWIEKTQADSEKWAEEQIKLDQEKATFAVNMNQLRLETERETVAGIGDLLQAGIKDEKEARRLRKIFAVADIGIALQQELAANAAAAALNPLNGPTLGIAGATQLALMNFKSILRAGLSTVKVLAFSKGGYTGPGDVLQPAGIVHAGEVVWSQEDVRRFGGVSAVESIRPTAYKGYATGGPVSPLPDRAQATRDYRGNSPTQNQIDWSPMERMMEEKIKKIRVINVVTDTEDKLNTLNRIRNEADA